MSKHKDKSLSINKANSRIKPFIIVFLVFDLLAFLVFLITSGTSSFADNLGPSSRYYTTIGYAENIDSVIEVYGRGTNKELDVEKCEKGICFKIDNEIEAINAQSHTIVTGANECTDSWAVNITTNIALGGTNANIIDHINGQKNPGFLKIIQANKRVLNSHNGVPLFAFTSGELPVYTTTGEQLYNAFYQEQRKALGRYDTNFKKTVDSDAINIAIKEAFDKPYTKSVNLLIETINQKVKSEIPTVYAVSTTIKGFDEKGDIDPNQLINNELVKKSFGCSE